jgi:uncharacterized membrane protein
VELLIILLLAGGIWLFAMQRSLAGRLVRLEAELASLHGSLAGSRPVDVPATATAEPMRAEAFARFEPGNLQEHPAAPEPVAGTAEPPPASQPEPASETLATLFERFVAGRLLIWIGGVALAVSGVFLVRYSIELGLIGPRVRMILAALFGLLLIGAGELARRRAELVRDERVPQALVGAGIFVLYAATYGALTLYGLISLGAASTLMALITGAALLLSLRHGAATAVMGLAGGFLTPALVGDPDAGAVPLLFYLGLLNLALFAIAHRRGWTWLAAAGILLSFLWTAPLVLMSGSDDALAAGTFVIFAAIGSAIVRPGSGRHLRLVQPALFGIAQLTVLVARGDLGGPAWALFAILSLACLILAMLRDEHRWLPVAALGAAFILLLVEAFRPGDRFDLAAAAGTSLLFGGFAYPLAAVRSRGRLIWTGIACAATAIPALLIRTQHESLVSAALWGGIFAALALGPALLAAVHARRPHAGGADRALVTAAATAALLLMVAVTDWVGPHLYAAGWLLVALGLAAAMRRVGDRGLALVSTAVAAFALIAALAHTGELWGRLQLSLIGVPVLVSDIPGPRDALVALLLPAALTLLLWRMLSQAPPWRMPVGSAGLLLAAGGTYILYKQLFGLTDQAAFVARGFAERTLLTQILFAAGALAATTRIAVPLLDPAARRTLATLLTGLAAARLVGFDLILHNPVWTEQRVGTVPLFNLLLPALGGGVIWLHLARKRAAGDVANYWLGAFLLVLIAGAALLVRQAFQGGLLTAPDVTRGEAYGYSLAGLLLSIALLVWGLRAGDRALRVAGLALLTATICKVFLIDASGLEGVLRILSFMGLGIALIGVNALYGKLLRGSATSPA